MWTEIPSAELRSPKLRDLVAGREADGSKGFRVTSMAYLKPDRTPVDLDFEVALYPLEEGGARIWAMAFCDPKNDSNLYSLGMTDEMFRNTECDYLRDMRESGVYSYARALYGEENLSGIDF